MSFKQAYLSISVIIGISNVKHKDKYLLRQSHSLLIMLYLENVTNEKLICMLKEKIKFKIYSPV